LPWPLGDAVHNNGKSRQQILKEFRHSFTPLSENVSACVQAALQFVSRLLRACKGDLAATQGIGVYFSQSHCSF
jgi:hypothetical protein